MKKGHRPPQAKVEATVNELEQEIEEIVIGIKASEATLQEKREQLFLLRSQMPGVCPWCGANGCEEADGACTVGLD